MLPVDDAFAPPLLTADLPGIGGKIKTNPEDFEVEEIPAYEPSGQGDFLYLWIEKRDIVANEVSYHAQASHLASVDSEAGANFAADRSKRFAQLPA